MGAYQAPDDGEQGGVDLEIDDRYPVARRPARAARRQADIGLGALTVGSRDFVLSRHDQGWWNDDRLPRPASPRVALRGHAR